MSPSSTYFIDLQTYSIVNVTKIALIRFTLHVYFVLMLGVVVLLVVQQRIYFYIELEMNYINITEWKWIV